MNRRQRTKCIGEKSVAELILNSHVTSCPCLSCKFFMYDAQATCTGVLMSSVIMAYSSNYGRVAPDRSRSRDDPPMWNESNSSRPRNPQYRDSWHQYPPPRQSRRVLVIVNLVQIRPLMNSHHCDAMEATTCRELPSLGRLEEYAPTASCFIQLKLRLSR
jgi:hypothetical protein